MKSFYFFVFFSLIGFSAFSQVNCATDLIHQEKINSDPTYAQLHKSLDKHWSNFLKAGGGSMRKSSIDTLLVPVVFHIIHSGQAVGTPKNPSDDSIASFVTFLNQEYAALSAGNPTVSNGGVDVPIRFVLAKRAPQCGTTTGVNRADGSVLPGYTTDGVAYGSGAPGVSDSLLKSLSRWSHTDYVNIYLVTYISGASSGGGGVGGYASLPVGAAHTDGIVLRYDQVKWALTHEMGHFLGLYHTFQGSSDATTCPSNVDCTSDGDKVCDTDHHPLVSGCPTGTNTCTNTSWSPVVYNFMNYSSCPNRFSQGQADRMVFMVENYRSSLLTSLGGVRYDSIVDQPIPPIASCIPPRLALDSNGYDMGPRIITLSNLQISSSGYTRDGYNWYVDHCASNCLRTAEVANLTVGQSYVFSVSSGINPEKVRAWIDYNNNGTFESGELVASHDGANQYETHTITFIVPGTAVTCTPLRMRIASDFYGAAAPTACGQLQYGQAEDILVMIGGTSAASNIISTNTTTPVCAGATVTYTANVQNAGTSPGYIWTVNSVNQSINQPTFTSSTLAKGDTIRCYLIRTTACGTSDTTISNYKISPISAPGAPVVNGTSNGGASICEGSTVTHTVAATNAGTASYFWFTNGNAVGTNQSNYSTNTLATGDIVKCVVKSSLACADPDSAVYEFPAVIVKETTDTTFDVAECKFYVAPNGNTYNSSQVLQIKKTGSNGCDSNLTINLTIYPDYDTAYTVTACKSYTAGNGNTYTSSQTITYSDQSIDGCDSVSTVNLVIKSANVGVTINSTTLTATATNATYQWLNCDNGYSVIPNATQKSYTPMADGNFAVQVTQNGCTDTSACTAVTGTGIFSYKVSDNIQVVPNPARTFVQIIGIKPTVVITSIRILNAQGQLVATHGPETVSNLPVSNLSSGLYFIQVLTETDVYNVSILKE